MVATDADSGALPAVLDVSDREQAKAIIREIIRQSGGAIANRTNLYKAFYLAHLYYYRDTGRILTDWPIVRMPKGPGVDQGRELTEEMRSGGDILIGSQSVGPYEGEVFTIRRESPSSGLDSAARAAIQEAVEFVSHRSATELSDILHEHSRSWQSAQDGEPLNIYLDLIPDNEYERLSAQHRRLEASFAAAFGR